ncbi:MAG: hypothetical protein JO256_10755 [Alphaproteobacteria bacterium]|nr:hypothetical protein [Alphaproteobacteria bacterium]
MRVIPSLPVQWRESLKASAERVSAPEKTSDSATLREEPRKSGKDAAVSPPPLKVELVCQDSTKAHDPFWDGPRLKPAFVAQLLAQVIASDERPTPRRVYGESESRKALLLDACF